MLFSIIIPTYNRCALLVQTLSSIWRQSFADYEVIVVDDGSTDGTFEYLGSLGSRVRMLAQENLGPGAARNAAATVAQGKYLAFLDSDDLWFPWTLETYMAAIQKREEPAFVVGKPFHFQKDTELAKAKIVAVKLNYFGDYLASGSEWRWWGASSFVVRQDAFAATGGFTAESVNGEDADLALRLGTARGFVQVTDPPTFGYRQHDGSVMKNFSKTLAGTWLAVNTENARGYPGGNERQLERWRILARHIRPVTLECLKERSSSDAWRLYRTTFSWNLQLRRWKYLVGFPLRALLSSGK